VTARAGRTELSARGAGSGQPPRLSPFVQYALLAGPLLSMLDSSVVNVAVEPIARQLHASLATVQWTVSGYLLALGAGLAGTAYLARRFGTLPVYRTSVIAFTIASATCAFAPGGAARRLVRVTGPRARPGSRPAPGGPRPGGDRPGRGARRLGVARVPQHRPGARLASRRAPAATPYAPFALYVRG